MRQLSEPWSSIQIQSIFTPKKKHHVLEKKGKPSTALLLFDACIEQLSDTEKSNLPPPRARPESILGGFPKILKGEKGDSLDGNASSNQSNLLLNNSTNSVSLSNSSPVNGAPIHNSNSLNSIADKKNLPDISGISPNNGPEAGGTVVTIRGTNLGLSKEDVLSLKVAGVECIETLMYVNQQKLICTTKQGNGEGKIEIKTNSGGYSISPLIFAFNPAAGTKLNEELTIPEDLNTASKKDLIDLVLHLQKKVKERDEDLHCVRQYIDKVLLRVIEIEPSILEGL